MELAPDAAWDGDGLTATKFADGVRLESRTGKILPLRLRREIRLDPYAARVSFTNAMFNDGAKTLRVALWQVTQVDRPVLVSLATLRTQAQPLGYWLYGRKELDPRGATFSGSTLMIRNHPTLGLKYGAKGGDGSISALLPSRELFVSSSPVSRRGVYPDSDSAKQVYAADVKTGYVELEHSAPLERLESGQVQVQTVTWTLKPGS